MTKLDGTYVISSFGSYAYIDPTLVEPSWPIRWSQNRDSGPGGWEGVTVYSVTPTLCRFVFPELVWNGKTRPARTFSCCVTPESRPADANGVCEQFVTLIQSADPAVTSPVTALRYDGDRLIAAFGLVKIG